MSSVDGQAIAGQADPPALEVVAELLVLDGVEAVLAADRSAASSQSRPWRVGGRAGDREEVVDHRPEDAEQLAGVAAVVGEVVDVGLAERVESRPSPRRSSGGPGACNTRGGIIASAPVEQLGEGAAGVDPEVVDDRLHRERQGVVEPALTRLMIAAISSRNASWRCGATKNAMPPPDIPPSIRKPQKSSPSAAFASRMIDSVKALLTQGMIRLSGPSQFRVVSPPSARTSADSHGRDDLLEDLAAPRAGPAIRRGSRSRYFSVTMFRIGPTFWAIPPWTRTRLSARASWNDRTRAASAIGAGRLVEQLVVGQQAAPADAPLGVALARPRRPGSA